MRIKKNRKKILGELFFKNLANVKYCKLMNYMYLAGSFT